jgi:DnaJ homolog subfamily C member 17
MSQKVSLDPDFGDPYELLDLEQSASESEINKAFRKLSLQLHPDKQHGKSEREKAAVAKRFHDINQAKEFLLDPTRRRPYDVQRGSRQRRQQQDKVRETTMSDRRRQMKQDLAEREASLRSGGVASGERRQPKSQGDIDFLNKLRKDGKRRRDEYAGKTAEAEYRHSTKLKKKEKSAIKPRQIRLKWSRKRISISPSEYSIADLLSKFGKVLDVEMIGTKGNQALVTFESASSCQPCVDFYAKHAEIRATLRGDEDNEAGAEAGPDKTVVQEYESLEEQRLRQAQEREQLIREMEQEDYGRATTTPLPRRTSTDPTFQQFPLEFPAVKDFESMAPFEKLQHFERMVFRNRISKELLAQIQM